MSDQIGENMAGAVSRSESPLPLFESWLEEATRQEPDVPTAMSLATVGPDGQPSETLRHRTEAAAHFGRRFARPLFIPTGGRGRHGDAEAVVMARLLRSAGYPGGAILTEETGTDTLSAILLGTTGPRGGHHDGLVQSAARSAARSVGSGLGRAILRGALGSILGGSTRRSR